MPIYPFGAEEKGRKKEWKQFLERKKSVSGRVTAKAVLPGLKGRVGDFAESLLMAKKIILNIKCSVTCLANTTYLFKCTGRLYQPLNVLQMNLMQTC